MGRKKQKKVKEFQLTDFVFVKVRGYRPWPARILQKVDKLYCVYFYGTRNKANVKGRQIYEYEKNKARLGCLKNTSYTQFKEAMEHAESTIACPDNDNDFFRAKAELENDVFNGVLEEKTPEQPWTSKTSLERKSIKSSLPFIHITGDSD